MRGVLLTFAFALSAAVLLSSANVAFADGPRGSAPSGPATGIGGAVTGLGGTVSGITGGVVGGHSGPVGGNSGPAGAPANIVSAPPSNPSSIANSAGPA